MVKYDPTPLEASLTNFSPLNPDTTSPDYNAELLATDTLRGAVINIASNDTGRNPFDFAVSGQAIVGTIQAARSGNTLTISDIHPTGKNNSFVITELGSDLIVADLDLVGLASFTFPSAANTGGSFIGLDCRWPACWVTRSAKFPRTFRCSTKC